MKLSIRCLYKYKLPVGVAVINTFVLLIATYFLNNWPRFTGEALEQLAITEWCKNKLGNSVSESDTLPLFINVGFDKQLVDVYDEFGLNVGNRDITDRLKLFSLLSLLSKADNYRYIFLDVRFEKGYSSETDSALFSLISKMPRIVVASHSKMELQDEIISGKTGLNDFYSTIISTNFVRYLYLNNDTLSLPLYAYKELGLGNITSHLGCIYTDKGSLCQISLFLRLPIDDFSEFDYQGNKKYYNLGADSLFTDEGGIEELAKDHVVVIGDMIEDVHDTYVGLLPGPVITYQAFQSLLRGDHLVHSWAMCLFSFVYFIISLSLFARRPWIDRLPFLCKNHSRLLRFILSFIGFTAILSTLSLCVCIIGGGVVTTLWQSLYFTIQKNIISYNRQA